MDEDRESTERLTADELTSLRSDRFSRLPDRVLPDELVEQVEAEVRTEVPEQAFDVRTWGEAGRFL